MKIVDNQMNKVEITTLGDMASDPRNPEGRPYQIVFETILGKTIAHYTFKELEQLIDGLKSYRDLSLITYERFNTEDVNG